MEFYSRSSTPRYSFSNSTLVFNEDGIQVHREENNKAKNNVKKEEQERYIKSSIK